MRESRAVGRRISLLLGCAVVAVATTSANAGAASVRQPGPAPHRGPALTVTTPQMADLVLDEAHGLLYGSDIGGGNVVVLSVPTLATVATISVGAGSQPIGIDLSPDGTTLAVALTNANFREIKLI